MPEPQDLGRDIRNSQLFCVKAYAEPHFRKFDRIVEGTGLAQPAQLGAKLRLHCFYHFLPVSVFPLIRRSAVEGRGSLKSVMSVVMFVVMRFVMCFAAQDASAYFRAVRDLQGIQVPHLGWHLSWCYKRRLPEQLLAPPRGLDDC